MYDISLRFPIPTTADSAKVGNGRDSTNLEILKNAGAEILVLLMFNSPAGAFQGTMNHGETEKSCGAVVML